MLTIKIILNDKGNPPGKLADAELHFNAADTDAGHAGTLTRVLEGIGDLADAAQNPGAYRGIQRELETLRTSLQTADPLAGLKLIGFAIWERRTGGGRNVTFPARSFSVNGERRSFALLRSIDNGNAQIRLSDLVLAAYKEYEDGCQTEGSDPTTYHVPVDGGA